MNLRSTRALSALLLLATIGVAQPGASAVTGPIRVQVDFKGGTLAQFAALLRSQSADVNIVAPDVAANVPVPAMQLRGVTPEAALRAASAIIEKDFDLNVQSIGQPVGEPVLALRVADRRRASPTMAGSMPAADAKQVEVFSLHTITRALPGEPAGTTLDTTTVLTAIDAGLGFVPAQEKPGIRFHEDSGLLFVSATVEQVQLVRSVLRQLETRVGETRAAARAAEKAAKAEKAEKADAAEGKKSPN